MASFVEQATLRVVDQSSSMLDRITAALGRLEAAAKRVGSLPLGNIGALGAAAGIGGNPATTSAARRVAAEQARQIAEAGQLIGLQRRTQAQQMRDAAALIAIQRRTRTAEERAQRQQERAAQVAEREARKAAEVTEREAQQARQRSIAREIASARVEARRVAAEERAADRAQRLAAAVATRRST